MGRRLFALQANERRRVTGVINRETYPQLSRHSLIVCGALIHNAVNLGGLCRTAEVFRLESLVLPSEAIAQSYEFRNVAASAHHWQPLSVCHPEQLEAWLEHQRSQGYCVVALHVDAAAVPITQFAFPEKTVLVLGKELTGIPESILQVCDRTVTIPQFGLVDSLNVQTAGAIAIYEYVRQHTGH